MRLKLSFCGSSMPELCEAHFVHPLLPRVMSSTRGKAAGAFVSFGSFQWTKAVKAVALLALKAKYHNVIGAEDGKNALIQGGIGTLAASLDYAIQKEPAWVLDLFGMDSSGTALIRRVFHRSNPGRKRVGPVAISWNSMFIPPKEIEIIWEDKNLSTVEDLSQLVALLESENLSTKDETENEKVFLAVA